MTTVSPVWADELYQKTGTDIYLPIVSDHSDGSETVLKSAAASSVYSQQHINQGGIYRNTDSNSYSEQSNTRAGRDCPSACSHWHRAFYIFDISDLPVSTSVSNVSLPYVSRWRGSASWSQPMAVYAFKADNFDSLSPENKYSRIESGTNLGTIDFIGDWAGQAYLSSSMQNLLGDTIETYRFQNTEAIGIGILRAPESGDQVALVDFLPNLQFDYEPTALCQGYTPTIYGTENNDTIQGTNGVDIIHGLGGNDTIIGKWGDDIICGGYGDDVIDSGDGNDRVYGDAGNDQIEGGWKKDFISGGSGNDVINGGLEDDTLYGGPGNDTIDGQNGRDIIHGGDGDDTIRGGAKADKLYGEAGNDRLYGEGGRDKLYGGANNDYHNGGSGNDSCDDTQGTNTFTSC